MSAPYFDDGTGAVFKGQIIKIRPVARKTATV